MIAASKIADRRMRLAKICLSLPGAACEDKSDYSAFLVGKKIFAYYLNNHHGDGIVGMWCKVLPGENAHLIASSPRKFYMPAYVGPRGRVGLRLDRPTVDWNEVAELVLCSYGQVAPGKLRNLPWPHPSQHHRS